MTDEPDEPTLTTELVPFHPIDTRYAELVDAAELRRAYAAALVVALADHVAIPVDRIGGLCGEIDAFLRGETTRIRAVK